MQSSNPVFTRSEGFNGRGGTGYADFGAAPAQTGYGNGSPTHTEYGVRSDRMTIDSVVQKTGLTLGVVVLAAFATWIMTPDITSESAARTLYTVSIVGALGGFVLSMVNSFKRVVSPPLVLAYAAFQGVAVGAFSKAMETYFSDGKGGLVLGAVLGTVAAVGGTLAAYKFFDIQVTNKFRTFVTAAMFGFVGLVLLDSLLSIFHASLGLNGFGGLGLLMSVIGLGIGVLMLILDFDFVERGVAAGLPERESWRAAFGLTVTIVWIYIELLRILAILRGD